MTDEQRGEVTHEPQTDAVRKAQKRRNLWLAAALFGFVVLVILITMIRLGGGVPERM